MQDNNAAPRLLGRDELLAALNHQQGFAFNGSDARALAGPVVYVLFRGESVMYVGMSKTGIGRPTSQAHHVLGGLQIADTDQLHVYPMPSEEAARDVERALIVRLQPAWNSKRMLSASLASTLGLRRNSAGVLARRIRDESNPDATTDKVHYVRVVQPGEYADVLAAPPVCSAALR